MRQQYDYSEFAPKQSSPQYDYSEFAPQQQSSLDGALSSIGNNLWKGARELGVGAISGMQSLGNVPSDMLGAAQEALGLYYPKGLNDNSSPVGTNLASYISGTNTSNADYEKSLGLNNVGLPGKLMEFAGSTAPLMYGIGAKAISSAPKILDSLSFLRPEKQAQGILDSLGGGMGAEQNSQSAAADIKNLYESKMQEGSQKYQPIMDKFGDKSIYPYNGNYNSLPDEAINSISWEAQKLQSIYEKDPTLFNAQQLQSQIGYDTRRIEKQAVITPADNNTLSKNYDVKNALQSDIDSFLKDQYAKESSSKLISGINSGKDITSNDFQSTLPSNYANDYKSATDWWDQNISPFRSNTPLMEIASGKVTNPNNLSAIFANGEPDIKDIAHILGDNFKNKIIYDSLPAASDAKALSRALGKLDDKGLASYITPGLQQQIGSLNKSIPMAGMLRKGAISGAAATGVGMPAIYGLKELAHVLFPNLTGGQ